MDIPILCILMEQLTGHKITPDTMGNRLKFVDESLFDSLYVCHENAQQKGVGRFLMDFAEKLAVQAECVGTWLVSGFGREEAHQFCKEFGYEITGYRFVKRIH